MTVVRLLASQTWNAELVPVAIAAMILAIAYNPNFALMITFCLSVLTCIALGTGLSHFLVIMGGTAAGVLASNDVRTRTKLIKVGATAALTYLLLTCAAGLWERQPIDMIRADGLWRAGWGLMAGFFLGGSLPFLENAFGIVTGISLLELGDITHPLLQELVRRAPGTYNHSITVGAIAEAAAERIGANALLVRIGAYFHDIGKMLKPHYFVENQIGSTSRHANLAPAMSTLIIIGHVKDGIDLGRQHHLPERIIDLIEQHHGTTLVEYFFHEANRRNGGNPDASTVPESAFRYPGPEAANQGSGNPHDGRLGGERQPDAFGAHAIAHRGPRQRADRQAAARRPVRRVRPDAQRNCRDPRQPDQVAHRHLPRSGQVSGTKDRLSDIPDANAKPHRQCLTRPTIPRQRTLSRLLAPSWSRSPTRRISSRSIMTISPRWRLASCMAKAVSRASISIALVDDAAIHRVNRAYLDHDCPTDVISFLLSEPDDAELTGELVVSTQTALAMSAQLKVPAWSELVLYVVHGLLHLCGYDDRSDEDVRIMRAHEKMALEREKLAATRLGPSRILACTEGREIGS